MDMMLKATLAALALLLPQQASANSSAYTKLDLDHCKPLSSDELGGRLKCEGYKSYPAYFTEGDLRQSMLYGPAAEDLITGSFESFGTFNSVNKTIEWRLDAAGKPFAAIQRWFIDNPDPKTGMPSPANAGQILVISRVAQQDDGLSCVVGYVDALANKNANLMAQEIADSDARDFACGLAEPMWAGVRGPKSSEPMRSLPDRLKVE
jgi:hypothetical protein